ncbi:MAG: hypothetical protein R2706_11970 [Acidimicrobiales bacterium]
MAQRPIRALPPRITRATTIDRPAIQTSTPGTFTSQTLRAQLANHIPPFILEGDVPPLDTWEQRGAAIDGVTAGQVIQGIPGCPGVSRGRARVW